MTFLSIWGRRGVARWLGLLTSAFLVALVIFQRTWESEFDWGARYLAASVYILSPVVAAATAYDVALRLGPSLFGVAQTSPRGGWAIAAPALTNWGATVFASVLQWVAVAFVVMHSGGLPQTDYWVIGETLAAYGAAVAVGLLVGRMVTGLLSVAVAAGVVLLAATFLGSADVPLFQVASSSGPLIGMGRTPARALSTIGCNVALILGALLLIRVDLRQYRSAKIARAAVTAVVPVIFLVAAFWPYTESEYQPVPPTACAAAQLTNGKEVTVCGPPKLHAYMPNIATSMADSLETLTGSELDLPARFSIVRGGAALHLPDGTAALRFESSSLRDGISVADVASTLATPRPCEAFFGNSDTQKYLELGEEVREWVAQQLQHQTHQQAPQAVRQAYLTLNQCRRIS